MKFLEPTRKPKVIDTDNSLEFGKSCEELSWNHCTSTPYRSETNGILWNVTAICEIFKINFLVGKQLMKGGLGSFLNWLVILFGVMAEYFSMIVEDELWLH